MKNPLKIGFDGKRAAANAVGIGNYSRTLVRHLSHYYPENEYTLYSPVIFNPEFSKYLDLPNVHLITPEESGFSPLRRANEHFWRRKKIAPLVEKQKQDLFHGLSHTLPENLKCPTVVTFHDLIFLRYPDYYPYFDRKSYEKYFKDAAKRADKIIAVSETTKNDLCEFYKINPDKIHVTWQSVDDRFKNTLLNTEQENLISVKYSLPKKFILSVGTIENRKNQDKVVEAFEKAHHRMPDVELIIAGGESKFAKEIKNSLKNSSAESKVKFLGYVPNEDLPWLYKKAWITIYIPVIEGFGIPVLESLTAGTPVITSEGTCLQEITGRYTSVLVNPNRTSSISDAMVHLYSDESSMDRMRLAIPQQIAKFAPETVASRVLNVYDELL